MYHSDIIFLHRRLSKNFSLDIKAGERIAIVGGSGSGKSTVLNMLCGINSPWSGTISFDGEDIQKISPFTKANSVSCVEQSLSIFEGTIYDNITMWNSIVSEMMLLMPQRTLPYMTIYHKDLSALRKSCHQEEEISAAVSSSELK